MSSLKLRLKKHLEDNFPEIFHQALLLGVSGGADSMAMLYLMQLLALETGVKLHVFHLNHQLRGDFADRDEAFVTNICARLSVPCETLRVDVARYARENRLSIEDAGRKIRLKAYADYCRAHDIKYVALGHHSDDQAESFLIRLVQGSRLKGLSGIQQKVYSDRFLLLHPMLCFSKTELVHWLESRNLCWCEDESNKEKEYLRNQVRLDIIPRLQELNPAIESHLNDYCTYFSAMKKYMDKQLALLESEIAMRENHLWHIDIPLLLEQDAFFICEWIHSFFLNHMGITLKKKQVDQIQSFLTSSSGKELKILNGIRLVHSYQKLLIGEPKQFDWMMQDESIVLNGHDCVWKQLKIKVSKEKGPSCQITLDARKQWKIRSFLPGDKIYVPKCKLSKKIKKIFQEYHIPVYLRKSIPIIEEVLSGEIYAVILPEEILLTTSSEGSQNRIYLSFLS